MLINYNTQTKLKYVAYLAACIPSHVELSLMRTLSLLIPACSYSSMNLLALVIDPWISNDSLQAINEEDLDLVTEFRWYINNKRCSKLKSHTLLPNIGTLNIGTVTKFSKFNFTQT